MKIYYLLLLFAHELLKQPRDSDGVFNAAMSPSYGIN